MSWMFCSIYLWTSICHRFCEIHISRIDVFIMFMSNGSPNTICCPVSYFDGNQILLIWLNHVCCTWKKVHTGNSKHYQWALKTSSHWFKTSCGHLMFLDKVHQGVVTDSYWPSTSDTGLRIWPFVPHGLEKIKLIEDISIGFI